MSRKIPILIFIFLLACTNQSKPNTQLPVITPSYLPSLGVYFPQKINTPFAYYDLAYKGELVLENGCLRLNMIEESSSEKESFLLIWDSRFSTRTEQGTVHVIDSNTGEILVSVGDFIEVGYNGDASNSTNPDPRKPQPEDSNFENSTDMGLREPIPDECIGPYFIVGHPIRKIDSP